MQENKMEENQRFVCVRLKINKTFGIQGYFFQNTY